MPYLTQLQGQFTRVVIKNISRLSRSYSIRIYELLQQFRSTGERIIALDDFRSMLDIEHKYQTYKSLNQQLLRPCIDELNKKSDLAVTVETIKGAHGCSPAFSLQGRQTNQDDDLKSILRHLKRSLLRIFVLVVRRYY